MRRFRDRRPAPFFRGGELPRLLTLVVFMGVLVMLMSHARRPDTWRWLTGEPKNEAADSARPVASKAPPRPRGTPQIVPGPTDLDSEERDAAREEFQAISDRTSLGMEEMPAYWRLVRWSQAQSFGQLSQRARNGVTFREIFEQPDRFRGKLVNLRLFLNQAVDYDSKPREAPFVRRVFEVFGANPDSQPYYYVLIATSVPDKMPLGTDLGGKITFAGYFLKLFVIEDHKGKIRAVPLLIGRLDYQPAPLVTMQPSANEWMWPWIVAGVLFVLFMLRWGTRLLRWQRPTPAASPFERSEGVPVEQWLEGAQQDDVGAQDESSPFLSHNPSDRSPFDQSYPDGDAQTLDGPDHAER